MPWDWLPGCDRNKGITEVYHTQSNILGWLSIISLRLKQVCASIFLWKTLKFPLDITCYVIILGAKVLYWDCLEPGVPINDLVNPWQAFNSRWKFCYQNLILSSFREGLQGFFRIKKTDLKTSQKLKNKPSILGLSVLGVHILERVPLTDSMNW